MINYLSLNSLIAFKPHIILNMVRRRMFRRRRSAFRKRRTFRRRTFRRRRTNKYDGVNCRKIVEELDIVYDNVSGSGTAVVEWYGSVPNPSFTTVNITNCREFLAL